MAESRGGSSTDADLVRLVQAGSTEAYDQLFRRHYRAVRRACVRRLGNRIDADEVAQAAFVRALERIEMCNGQRRFGPWVHVIAYRLCVDWIRARARVQPEEEPWPEEPAGAGRGDPEASVLGQEQARHVREALSTLNRRQREAMLARAVEDQGPQEIAASLGMSVRAVDSLLHRGRRRLALAYARRAGDRGPLA